MVLGHFRLTRGRTENQSSPRSESAICPRLQSQGLYVACSGALVDQFCSRDYSMITDVPRCEVPEEITEESLYTYNRVHKGPSINRVGIPVVTIILGLSISNANYQDIHLLVHQPAICFTQSIFRSALLVFAFKCAVIHHPCWLHSLQLKVAPQCPKASWRSYVPRIDSHFGISVDTVLGCIIKLLKPLLQESLRTSVQRVGVVVVNHQCSPISFTATLSILRGVLAD